MSKKQDIVIFMLNAFLLKTLLRHGANPDLRDEDGKTPLDKARERGHSEVVAILQSPGELYILFFFFFKVLLFSFVAKDVAFCRHVNIK
jgi:ankyrin repeat protein